jgi:hypothetical protein
MAASPAMHSMIAAFLAPVNPDILRYWATRSKAGTLALLARSHFPNLQGCFGMPKSASSVVVVEKIRESVLYWQPGWAAIFDHSTIVINSSTIANGQDSSAIPYQPSAKVATSTLGWSIPAPAGRPFWRCSAAATVPILALQHRPTPVEPGTITNLLPVGHKYALVQLGAFNGVSRVVLTLRSATAHMTADGQQCTSGPPATVLGRMTPERTSILLPGARLC